MALVLEGIAKVQGFHGRDFVLVDMAELKREIADLMVRRFLLGQERAKYRRERFAANEVAMLLGLDAYDVAREELRRREVSDIWDLEVF